MSSSTTPNEPAPPTGEWWSDEPQMETYQHLMAMIGLIVTLRWHWRDRSDYFIGGNLSVYYSEVHSKRREFTGPDIFIVQGVSGHPRRSWVVWQEDGRYPDVIFELVSDSTEANDRGGKKRVYERIFRTPEYFLFDPHSYQLDGFHLVDGRYEPIVPDAEGRLISHQLDLLVGVRGEQLRLFTREGAVVATPEEAALEALKRAEAEAKRADDAEAKLRDR